MTTAYRPLICLTLRGRPFDAARQEPTTAPFEWITNAFAACIVQAGGTPLLLSNECPIDEVARIVALTDALFLTGGEDVHPRFFNEQPAVDNLTINERRDEVELAAVTAADQLRLPILGVCRGIQMLNIARGGTIYQDLKAQHPKPLRDHSRGPSRTEVQTHQITVAAGARLADILGVMRFHAATDHHQAVRDLGRELKAVAHAPEDDVIEAVEQPGERFVIGVQWHPEVRPDDEVTRRLFAAFIAAAADFATAHGPLLARNAQA